MLLSSVKKFVNLNENITVYNLQIYSKSLMHFPMKITNFFQIIYFLEQL